MEVEAPRWPRYSSSISDAVVNGGLLPEAYLHLFNIQCQLSVLEGINMDPIFTTITPDEGTRLEC